MSAGDQTPTADGGDGATRANPTLAAPDMEALDLLVEHGFDAAKAASARPELAARIDAAMKLFARLDEYPVESSDDSLVDATLARIAQAEREEESRMRLAPPPVVGSGRWPDLWAVACVALVLIGVGLPLANWMQSRAAEDSCANNLRSLGGGLARYVGDHGAVPFNASLAPDLATLDSWANLGNNRHLSKLTDGNYAETQCLCCPNDAGRNGYAYQVPSDKALRTWTLGVRVPVIADRNPAIELTRAGHPVGLCVLNSPDHGGAGQNALFTDVSVEFLRNTTLIIPAIEDDPRHLENIYLPMSAEERAARKPEQDLDRPSEWAKSDVFLLN